jgi:adenosylcobinamide-GDP ribazoletransferase
MTLSLSSMPPTLLPFIMLCGDVWAKWTSSNIVNILPYARDLNGAKNGVVYRRMNLLEAFSCVLFATLPVGLCIALGVALHAVVIAMCLSGFSAAVFFLLMKRKIGGYTGDCCGAVCLLSEMVFHLALLTVVGISSPFAIPA